MSKVVIANYNFNEVFKVPKGINLEDKTVVKSWTVKWNKLYVVFVDGVTKVIEGEGWTDNMDFNDPSEPPVIENAEDWCLEDDEDDEDAEEEHEDAEDMCDNCGEAATNGLIDDKFWCIECRDNMII